VSQGAGDQQLLQISGPPMFLEAHPQEPVSVGRRAAGFGKINEAVFRGYVSFLNCNLW
jgi:hypothetical protein